MVGAGLLGAVYGAVAARRRRWYAAHPERRRRLRQPVVSVGALTVGGSGKTPVAAEVARLLASLGEQPAILSRGYGRQRPSDGVVVVSERGVVRAAVESAGDEPLMLARQLSQASVSVVVAADRYLAGRLAEQSLGATVHILDDGYQHLALARDVDILVMRPADLNDQPLPAGRLRESPAAGRGVDAVVVETDDEREAHAVGRAIEAPERFRCARRLGTPQEMTPSTLAGGGVRTLAVCGIAKPETFVDALRRAGYDVVASMSFGDHHVYSSRDIDRIRDRVIAAGAGQVLTTEKDAVRFESVASVRSPSPVSLPFPLAWMPLQLAIEPADRFRAWLAERVASARQDCQ